uniref:Ribonuclease H protein At1g65750 family n=1 Tax=Cajanus cajan TaxID=3821 RepID=A0A151S8U8_CAJCA|nr:Putative ribonuclease H protein At1g65750 family [Cajanus cajan]
MKTKAVRFFKELFSINNAQGPLDMHAGVPPGLGGEALSALTAPVTKEEVRRAVMSMKSFKAPGPDGFQPFFFKQYWPIVGDELWRTVKDAFRLGYSDISLLETQMVLIPKVDHPVSLKEFRPISLCNVAWKVISKVLVARLRPFLPDVIGPFQGSFIPGRGTRDHNIIAQEAFHFVRKEGSDPLSPYLFVFCMERLALRISELLQEGLWKPIQLSPGGLSLSHLFFADDILLFCQASDDQAHLVASTLEELSRSSGLRVNLTKSKFVSSRRVSLRRIDTLEGLLGIGHTARIGKYLGVPMTHGQPRCADFYDVLDKIQIRLAAWKSKLLNKAGKLCLVKSTISSIPVYSMQTLWLPQAVCNRIDQACRRMLWAKSDNTRFWSPVSWDVVTQPQEFGGLGVREARKVNVSLLGKLVWDMLTAPQKPWV